MVAGRWACATVGKTHGLHGAVYLDLLPEGLSYLEGASEFLLARGEDVPQPVVVERLGGDARRPLVRLSAAATREEAAALHGAVLLASGGALMTRAYYAVAELLGMTVQYRERELGEVDDVLLGVSHDILSVRTPNGGPLLVPCVDDLISVDLVNRHIVVRNGLLDE